MINLKYWKKDVLIIMIKLETLMFSKDPEALSISVHRQCDMETENAKLILQRTPTVSLKVLIPKKVNMKNKGNSEQV